MRSVGQVNKPAADQQIGPASCQPEKSQALHDAPGREPSAGSVKAWTTIENSPGLEDLWQLHFSN
jgi:hypothetical protein